MSVNVDIDAVALDRLHDANTIQRQYKPDSPGQSGSRREQATESGAKNGSRLYVQFADPAYRRSEYVVQGFSWLGLLFGGAWLIFHGMRGLLAIAILSLTISLGFILFASVFWTHSSATDIGVLVPFSALLFAHLMIGLQGSQWRLSEYRRRGWKEIQILAAPSLAAARQFGEIALHQFKSVRREDLALSEGVKPESVGGRSDVRSHARFRQQQIDRETDPDSISWTDAGVDLAQREAEVAMVGEEYREFVRTAQRELQKAKVHKAIWARAFATYADDVASVRRRYICLRAESLAEEAAKSESALSASERHPQTISRIPAVRTQNSLSEEEVDSADRQIGEFVEDVVEARRFDRYSTDLVGSTLSNYHQLPDSELSHRLQSIGLRLDVLSGPGSHNKPEFTEYRIVSETGDLLHLPDRGWFGLFLEKLYEQCRDANIVVSHAYVHGNASNSVSSGERNAYGSEQADARDYFFRYMEENGDQNYDVFQRSIDGPDIEVRELWERESWKHDARSGEQDRYDATSAERDSYSIDWVNAQEVPNRAERLRRQGGGSTEPRRVNYDSPPPSQQQPRAETGKRFNMRLTDRRTKRVAKKPGANLRPAKNATPKRNFLNEDDREFLTSLVRDENSRRIGIFRDSN